MTTHGVSWWLSVLILFSLSSLSTVGSFSGLDGWFSTMILPMSICIVDIRLSPFACCRPIPKRAELTSTLPFPTSPRRRQGRAEQVLRSAPGLCPGCLAPAWDDEEMRTWRERWPRAEEWRAASSAAGNPHRLPLLLR